MSKKKHRIEEIQLRKQKLQDEISLIEEKYSQKANKLSSGIQNTLKPIQSIRDNPLKSLGISIAVGVVIGLSGRRKKSSKSPASSDSGGQSVGGDSGFSSMLMSELKRMAAKRAMMYISDIIDRKVMPEMKEAAAGKEAANSEPKRD